MWCVCVCVCVCWGGGRFFSEIFKTHGPLKPSDPTLTESLSLLPEEKKIFIAEAGGIETFLLQSPNFCSHDGVVCLSEDSPVITDSITLQVSSSTSSLSEPPVVVAPDDGMGEGSYESSSSSSSITSGASPRDTPTDSPQVKKKTVERPNQTTRDKKPAKPATNSDTATNSSSGGESATASVGSSSGQSSESEPSIPQTSLAIGSSSSSRSSSSVDDNTEPSSGTQPVDSDNDSMYGGTGLHHQAVQTDRVRTREQCVMTEPMPLPENFKERYEMVLREKIDLRAKLEESEDRRFKMQRDHKREQEKMSKSIRTEAREVGVGRGREGGRDAVCVGV